MRHYGALMAFRVASCHLVSLLRGPAAVALLGAATRDENEEPRDAFAIPWPLLMWKSGTRHVLMARAAYGAPDRDVKVR